MLQEETEVSVVLGREELPLSWKYALLAVLPGLLATEGLTYIDFSTKMLAGAVLLAAYLTFAYFWDGRRFPGWSLMAAGMLTSMGLTVVSGVLGGLASTLVGLSANIIVLLMLLVTLVAIFIFQMQGQPISWRVWMLIMLIMACQLVVRVKYFTLFGQSWSTAGDWLSISLYSAVTGLLLPVVFGLFPARKHGLLALLFAIGMIYMGIQLLIDVNQKVSAVLENGPGLLAYKAMTPLLFTVLAPLWFLRARSSRSRIIGLLVISGVATCLQSFGGRSFLRRSAAHHLGQLHPVHRQRPADSVPGILALQQSACFPSSTLRSMNTLRKPGE